MRPLAAGSDHRDIDVAGAAARDKRLGAVQHIIVAVASGARRQRRGVRAAPGFGQAVAGKMIHPCQLWQKSAALLDGAKAVDHPRDHVVDRQIRGGRNAGGSQFLEQDRGIDAAEPAAAEFFANIDRGKAQRRGPPQRLDREFLALVPARGLRQPFLAGKYPRGLLKRPLFVGKRKIHGANIAAADYPATNPGCLVPRGQSWAGASANLMPAGRGLKCLDSARPWRWYDEPIALP